ncbi:hypothetical protein [Trueperella pyogenes]
MKPFIIIAVTIYTAGLIFGVSSATYLWFDAPDKEQRKMATQIARGAPLWPIWGILTLINPRKDDKTPVAEPEILSEITIRIILGPDDQKRLDITASGGEPLHYVGLLEQAKQSILKSVAEARP